jgi:hypothetical protein
MLCGVCLFAGSVVGVGIWASDVLDEILPETPTATVPGASRLDAIAQDDDNNEPTVARSLRRPRAKTIVQPLQTMEAAFARGQWAGLPRAGSDNMPPRAVWPCATSLESLHVRLQI